jgi:hypothetical protein
LAQTITRGSRRYRPGRNDDAVVHYGFTPVRASSGSNACAYDRVTHARIAYISSPRSNILACQSRSSSRIPLLRHPINPCAMRHHATRRPESPMRNAAKLSSAVCKHDTRCCKALLKRVNARLHVCVCSTQASDQTLRNAATASSDA